MGARLKELREQAGLSQVKLAQAAGVSPRAVQNWEYGKRTFDFEAAIKLSQALGCTLNELAGIEPASRPSGSAGEAKKGKGGKGK
jgi:transcriptional regulator with XRE-family HTH domain